MTFRFADFFAAWQADPQFLNDAEKTIADVATGQGGMQKVKKFSVDMATLVAHGQNSIAVLAASPPPPVETVTTGANGAVTTVTTSTTPPA